MANTNSHCIDLEASSSQTLSIADASQTGLDLSGDFTMEMWIEPESLPTSGNTMILIHKSQDAGNERGYFWHITNNAGTMQVRIFISEDGAGTTTDDCRWNIAFFDTANPYHLAVTCDISEATATQFELFINGISQGNGDSFPASGNCASINNNAIRFTIGGGPTDASSFDGKIDEVRVWSTIRTQAQIQKDMRNDSPGTTTGLQGFWKLNNALTDSSGNGNTLTNNNVATFSTSPPFATYGETDIYSVTTGYGYVDSTAGAFSTVRSATTGSSANDNTAILAGVSVAGGGAATIFRGFAPFNVTGGLNSSLLYATIDFTASNLLTDEANTLVLVQSSQASTSALATTDYDDCGDLNSPTEGATRFNNSGLTANKRYFWDLNATGLGWIVSGSVLKLGIRGSADVDNSSPSAGNETGLTLDSLYLHVISVPSTQNVNVTLGSTQSNSGMVNMAMI